MRENVLRKLDDLNNQLTMLGDNLTDWMNSFIAANQLSDGTVLCAYNTGVLSWISKWASNFHQAILQLPAFESENDDVEIEKILKRKRFELKIFVDLRNQFLPKGIRDVSRSPFMIAHIAFVSAVEAVKAAEESTCLWLMPWVKHVIGSAETDIKKATEDKNGKFTLSDYVPGEIDDSLIAVLDYLDYVHTGLFASDFFSSDARRFAITSHLKTPALNYIRALEYYHIRSTANLSHFGFHVVQFAAVLHECSVNRLGKEWSAHNDYEASVIAFYQLWESLRSEYKEGIRSSRIPHFSDTFENCLLTLFITVPSISLQEDVKAKIEEKKIIKCAAILSTILFAFVRNHQHWYEIPVGESSEKLMYTPDDIANLREILKQSLDGHFRIHHCEDAVIENLKLCHQESYQHFFTLSQLIPLMNEVDLLEMAKNPQEFFSKTDKILTFIEQLPTASDRIKYWSVFEITWKELSFKIRDIIFLFSLFDESKTEHLCHFFSQKIRSFFSLHRLSFDFESLEAICDQFSTEGTVYDYKNMYHSFIMKIIIHAPDIISDPYAFSKCFTAFTTEEECQAILRAIGDAKIGQLFANHEQKFSGAILLEFFKIMRRNNKKNPFQSDLNNAFFVVIKSVISQFRLSERIDSLCDMHSACGCSCWSFFSEKNVPDQVACKKLMEVNDRVKTNALSPFDACCEKIKILHEFMRKNEGAQFLQLVNRHFCVDFLKAVNDIVSSANVHRHHYHPPTLVLGR